VNINILFTIPNIYRALQEPVKVVSPTIFRVERMMTMMTIWMTMRKFL